MERWAVATPRVSVDRSAAEAAGLTDTDIDEMIDRAAAQAQAYIAQEQSYLVDNPVVSLRYLRRAKAGFKSRARDYSTVRPSDLSRLPRVVSCTSARPIRGAISRRGSPIGLPSLRAQSLRHDLRRGRWSGPASGRNHRPAHQMELWRVLTLTAPSPRSLRSRRRRARREPQRSRSAGSIRALTPEDDLERAIRERIGAGRAPRPSGADSYFDRVSGGVGGGAAALSERYRKLKEGRR